MNFPSISVIIPTLNAEKYLDKCLHYLVGQDYPKRQIETIIVDGGSKDKTISIARKYSTKIFHNPLKTSEAGKAIGIRNAKNELILLIDSDNLIIEKNWLQKMIIPFQDPEIIASEPIRYDHRESDSLVNRYCALIGMNDPLCMFIGNYDRYNYITGKWTEIPLIEEKREGYIKFRSKSERFMTMGANGFLVRRQKILQYALSKYYFDIDVTKDLALNKNVWFAKVDVGIVHLFADSVKIFFKKQKRRVMDFFHFNKKRNYQIGSSTNKSDISIKKLLLFSIMTILIVPLILQAVTGYIKKPDKAWLFHYPACFITFIIYSSVFIVSTFNNKISMMTRDNW